MWRSRSRTTANSVSGTWQVLGLRLDNLRATSKLVRRNWPVPSRVGPRFGPMCFARSPATTAHDKHCRQKKTSRVCRALLVATRLPARVPEKFVHGSCVLPQILVYRTNPIGLILDWKEVPKNSATSKPCHSSCEPSKACSNNDLTAGCGRCYC